VHLPPGFLICTILVQSGLVNSGTRVREEALFKLLGESALFADSHQQRQFPQALFSFFFATFFFLRASL
jgi:hypothetical protein